ncbi:ATP-dependent nuclease [Clostridium perfringens]|uniref:ATP-dependent nuclease n=1 Tax=Clostridium perfringens TaxID=1502 RepID=UPI001CCD0D36|nr:AAA family ATPase [Clostridium perfringens]MDY2582864.1 AAA family ATPase [Clostridium perfringens]UUR83904.1 AAA family ATPase [Clostridium perfringens]
MKLRELIIKNYGCIGEDELRVVIDDIIVLIGPNNVGKTTVLNAYESFAGAGVALDKNKFHKNCTDSPIEISGIFSDITEEDKVQIGEKWIFSHQDYNKCIKYKYVWKKEDTKGVKYSWNNNEKKWEKGGMGGWDTKITSCIPVPIKINPLDSPEELQKQIIEILSVAIKEKSKNEDGRIKELIDNLNTIAEEVKKEIEGTLDITTDKLEENMKHIFPDCKILIKPQAGKFEPEKIIASGSHIRVKDLQGNDYPLSSQGAGLQRTFLWSAIEALSEAGNYKKGKTKIDNEKPRILLIEEPESFLHPPAIRAAREALYKIAEIQNWQVMITTHSPVFIDVSKPHTTIIRVDRDINSETRIFSTEKANFDEDERQRLQMIRMCNPTINEFFFANDIILVEGDTEQSVLNYIKTTNLKYTGIQIVNCYGKANIPMFMKILNHFGVNYTAIHDIDAPYAMRKDKKIKNAMWTINEKIFKESKIDEGVDNMIIANMPDFEFQYFKYLQSGDKPYNAICELKNEKFINSDRYNELVNIFESINNRRHKRSIRSISDYYILLCSYIEKETPNPIELWELEEAIEVFTAYKEASATDNK